MGRLSTTLPHPASIAIDQSQTLADRVFEQIQTAIVRGEIPSGSKLSEADLARQYGISRGPLREAMRRLEARRLLEHAPHVGARVVSLSHPELIEIYSCREALEGMACRLAAEQMHPDEIDALYKLLADHESQVRDGAPEAGYYQKEGDLDFHYRIIQGSNNETLTRILIGELYYLVRMYRYQFSTYAHRTHQAIKDHYQIVDAIAARDGELAEMLMRRHIGSARKNIEASYQEHLNRGSV